MQIKWGIIGCGDVTEIKSGPAFQKVENSSLVAVMRRNGAKAEDFAVRHGVSHWYSNAQELIDDPEVNAIYVATPPSSHAEYSIAAIRAGKPVYVEKPMGLAAADAEQIAKEALQHNIPLTVAHYRRQQPLFRKAKELLSEDRIGTIRSINLLFSRKSLPSKNTPGAAPNWRVNPAIAGGGLFHDLAPHQLDILLHWFGNPVKCSGITTNQGGNYNAPDAIVGLLQFEHNILFSGNWNFALGEKGEPRDYCEITGDRGLLRFSFFDQNPLVLQVDDHIEEFHFAPLPHVQQPMIDAVVRYFRGEAPNPCSGEEGVAVMKMIDAITAG